MSSRFPTFRAETSGEEQGRPVLSVDEANGRPVLSADGARGRSVLFVDAASSRPAAEGQAAVQCCLRTRQSANRCYPRMGEEADRPTVRAAPTNDGQRGSRSAPASRPDDSQFVSLDISLVNFYTTNIHISRTFATFQATKSGNDNFRSVLSAARAATSLGAQCSLGTDQPSRPALRAYGPTTPKGRLEYLRRLGVFAGKFPLFHRFSACLI